MKKHLLTTCFILLIRISFGQFIFTNQGFESGWLNGNPNGWAPIGNSIAGVQLSPAPPFSGVYSLKTEVVAGAAGQSLPGVRHAVFPVASNYATLSFYYQFYPIGSASLDVNAIFYDNSFSIIGGGSKSFTASVNSWTLATIQLNYSANAQSSQLFFQISDTVNPNPSIGNYFLLDEVGMSGNATVGVAENTTPGFLNITNIQPNPVNDFAYIYYSLPSNDNLKFELYDFNGSLCKTIEAKSEVSGKHKIEMYVGELKGGIYLLRMSSTNATTTARFVIVK